MLEEGSGNDTWVKAEEIDAIFQDLGFSRIHSPASKNHASIERGHESREVRRNYTFVVAKLREGLYLTEDVKANLRKLTIDEFCEFITSAANIYAYSDKRLKDGLDPIEIEKLKSESIKRLLTAIACKVVPDFAEPVFNRGDVIANHLLLELGFYRLTDKTLLETMLQGRNAKNYTIIGKTGGEKRQCPPNFKHFLPS